MRLDFDIELNHFILIDNEGTRIPISLPSLIGEPKDGNQVAMRRIDSAQVETNKYPSVNKFSDHSDYQTWSNECFCIQYGSRVCAEISANLEIYRIKNL